MLDIERGFHARILSEPEADRRRELYAALYSAVHPLLALGGAAPEEYRRLARLFRPELSNRSVLDVGCGDGAFLRAIAQYAGASMLLGLDTYRFPRMAEGPFTFIQGDIAAFTVPQSVEVMVSSQVLEHIAPADADRHMDSIYQALVPGGRLILMTPNRLWGPHDITRVYDHTNTNRTAAIGSHLKEYTYREAIELLRRHGFADFSTVIPFAERIPALRAFRIAPRLNLLLESWLAGRNWTYRVKWHGRALFKNPIVLVARKAG